MKSVPWPVIAVPALIRSSPNVATNASRNVGARHVAQRGVIPYQVGPAAESLVVHGASVYVPARLFEELGDRLLDALERRIGAWRRESHNEELEIPMYGPNGEVLRLAKSESDSNR